VSDKNGAVKAKRKRAQRFEPGTPDVASLAREYGYENCVTVAPPLPEIGSPFPGEPVEYQVHVEPSKATKKIAIVGKAPSTIPLAPYNDPEWEIWGLSDLILHEKCTRWTRWFELHDPEGWHPDDSVPRRQKWHPKYWEHLTKQPPEGNHVYVAAPHPEMPYAELFPWERLVERFSLRDESDQPKPYFTNTVSWLIAYAIDQGATHISVYGVDMAQQEKGVKSEYAYQRPSCEYFLGIAHGMGIKTFVPKHSDLMKAVRLYGIDRLSPVFRDVHRKRSKDLRTMKQQAEQELAQLDNQRQQKRDRLHVIIGALDDCDQYFGQQVI
jgi:hypothetical protein